MKLILFLFFSIIYYIYCLQKFTIHSQGKNIITTKVTNQGECSSIAITQEGGFIRYKSDSSIMSFNNFDSGDINLQTSEQSNYFMCQISNNNIILVRGNEMIKIILDGKGNIHSIDERINLNRNIISLQCNLGNYIITYLTEDNKCHFKILDSIYTFNCQDNFKSSSCFLVDNIHVLCINTYSSEIKYFYYSLSTSTTSEISLNDLERSIISLGNNFQINGSIIKYWSNNEILICINVNKINPLEDINLVCYMTNIVLNNNILSVKNSFITNKKVTNNINFCQIEKLSSPNLYASICLTYYYKAIYLLSIFKFDNNEFKPYNGNGNYIDIQFSLLDKTYISITSFDNDSLGIFFKDIDNDSMILMFYPKCGYNFQLAPKNQQDNCLNIETTDISSDGYYYDECTHSFMEIPQNYSEYKRNQYCKIKKISCNTNDNYILDSNNNFGTYECWKINNPPLTYYFDGISNQFQKCFRTCLSCNEEGNEENNNCASCKDNFYFIINTNNCHFREEPIDYYYFHSTEQKFINCREECLTCTELGNDEDTKCTKCKDDFWPLVDKPSHCISKNRKIENYYAFETYKSFEKCFEGCKLCSELGTNIYDTKCDIEQCSENYANPVDNNRNCFKKNARYNGYFYDSFNNRFEQCNQACLQCDEIPSPGEEDTKCLELKCNELDNYYPNEDYPHICYHYEINNNPKYYYFNPDIKKYRKCQKGCLYCKEQIYANENDTQCTQCDNGNGYFVLNDSDENNLNCYHESRKGYYKKNFKMYKCPEQCSECEYINPDIKCTECNNNIGFYELEKGSINPNYKDCKTIRAEKLRPDTNLLPPDNTILVNNIYNNNGITKTIPMFRYCSYACLKCTGLYESEFETHCQAKQCNTNYAYILNYEDICYSISKNLSLHFLYEDEDTHEKYFKPCYETCETCLKSGNKRNNNCNSCRTGYIFHPNQITNSNNCIFNCLSINNYFYLDMDNNDEYICVDKCPENYPYLQPDKKQCLKSCSNEDSLKYSRNWICISECPLGTQPDNFNECISISNNCIKSELESNYILQDINDTNINDFIINYCHDYSYTSQQITVIKNKLEEYKIFIYKNKDCLNEFFNNNINFPDLSICIDELKNTHHIKKNQDLIIMIMNIYNKNTSISVEYKIFNSITCEELYLDNCTQNNISIYVSMNKYFNEAQIQTAKKLYEKGIIPYNRTDPFFTDICYEFTSENDKDVILEDRVDEFYQSVEKICEKNCTYDADFENEVINCICELKTNFLEIKNEDNEEQEFNFGIGSISINVVKCAKKAFLWDYFKNNVGSYTALILIVAEFPVIFYFIKFGLSQVKVYLIPFMGANPPKHSFISSNVNENNEINNNTIDFEEVDKENDNELDNDTNNINNDNYNYNDNYINSNKESKYDTSEINSDNNYRKIEDSNKEIEEINSSKTHKIQKSSINSNDKNSNDSLISSKKSNSKKKNKKKKKNYDIYKEIKDNEDLNDIELFDAIIFDKRKFCEFYWEELQNTQPIIYSFIYQTPLTPKFFKILLFIFNTILCFEFNAFFYSRNYISKKYYNYHNNFSWYVNHIYDRILLVCACTIFLNLFIRVLTNSKKKIQMWIKREKDQEKLNKELIYMTKRMKINYIVFMCVQGIFMFFFWLYLSCFCNCYKNNELEWFVTSLICFGIIQIWYFFSTFIVTCLRFLGIKLGMESCYNVSLCLAYD